VEQRVHRRVALRRHLAEGVIDQMVDYGSHVAARIVLRDVPDRVQVVRQRPLYRFVSAAEHRLLGQRFDCIPGVCKTVMQNCLRHRPS